MKPLFYFVLLSVVAFSLMAHAQPPVPPSVVPPAPGQWQFVVSTDLSKLPADMKDNFPDVDYEKCIPSEDIGTPRAFGLQASPAMWNRCSTEDFVLEGGKLAYRFQCDGGATLTGEVRGTYTSQRVMLTLISRPRPVVRDVESIHQTITAKRISNCKPETPKK